MPKRGGRTKKRPVRRRRRKTVKRTARYTSRSRARNVGRYTSIIRPITLKPKFQLKRLQYYNTAQINMGLGQSGSQASIIQSNVPIFFKMRLNSPYVVQSMDGLNVPVAAGGPDFTQYTGSTYWNKPVNTHANADDIDVGAAYEGWAGPGSPAYGYSQYCVLGTKVTVSYTPIGNTSTSHASRGAAPTAFFGFIETNTSDGIRQMPRNAGSQPPSQIEDIYKKPYCKVRKILPTKIVGGSAGNISYAGGGTSSSMTFTYSPKRMNGIKDIADNQSLWGAVNYTGNTTTPLVNHPNEGDYITIGFMPLMDDRGSQAPQSSGDPIPMQSGMLQIKMETVIAFREPITGTSPNAAGNVALAAGGDAGGGDIIGMVAAAAAQGAVGAMLS